MIKKALKNLFKKIYLIGKFEADTEHREEVLRQQNEIRDFKVTLDPTANIFGATIHNRFNDKSKIIVGKETQIRGELEVSHTNSKIVIGDYTYIGQGTRICSSQLVSIGNRVLIAHNVNIYDNNSHPLTAEERHQDFLFTFSHGYQRDVDLSAKPVIIEDDVWIGFNSIILKGVRIGKGAVIGAGTLIVKDVPPNAIVVGNPARIVKYVDQ